MVDFVEEVEERLRSDRYRELARRTWPWVAAALVALIVGWLGVWAWQSWRDRDIGKASIGYEAAITALAQGDETGAFTRFDQVGRSGPAGYRALALIQQGNLRLAAGKPPEAAAFYDRAAKAAPNAIFGDLARLRAAQALLDTAAYGDIAARLAPLIGEGKPFTLAAREALALAKLRAGQAASARNDFSALTLTLGVSQAMRSRAQAAIALIDSGEGRLVGSTAQAAAALPVQASMPPGGQSPGPAGPNAAPGNAGAGAPQ